MNIFFSKLKFISIIFLISFIFSKQSYSNELDKISACAGVVMGDGAAELRDLQNEKNFDKAASIHSISDTSKSGGKLGWIPMSALNQKIKKELLNINIGDFTKPIVIPGGFLIIKINDARKIKDKIDIKKEVESVAERKTNEQLIKNLVFLFLFRNLKS